MQGGYETEFVKDNLCLKCNNKVGLIMVQINRRWHLNLKNCYANISKCYIVWM